MPLGPFDTETDVASVCNNDERYVPLVDPYNAPMHLGHMAAYKHALCYAYGRSVLDIGCGTGYGAHYLASFGAKEVAAVDTDLVALDYARKAYAHPHVQFQCSDGNYLPFADASFDFVFSSQVIEHIVKPMLFLAEIKRVLKLGGFCLITTPNKDLFSPNCTERTSDFHINEMSLAQFKELGCAIFPHVEIAGIAQNSLVRQSDGKILLKSNKLLSLNDYQVGRNDLINQENMLLFGHTQAYGEFSATLPNSLSHASTNLGPCFWDATEGRWIELGLYPDTDLEDDRVKSGQYAVQQIFRSPCDNIFRIDVGLEEAGAGSVEIELRNQSRKGQLLVQAIVKTGYRRLSVRFEPIENSAGRELYLELRPRRSWLDILLHRKDMQTQFEYRGDQLAFWTFHQTLPAITQ